MQNVGSRASVMYGMAKKTSGGLTKDDLMYNEKGQIVSKKKSMMARKNMRGGSGNLSNSTIIQNIEKKKEYIKLLFDILISQVAYKNRMNKFKEESIYNGIPHETRVKLFNNSMMVLDNINNVFKSEGLLENTIILKIYNEILDKEKPTKTENIFNTIGKTNIVSSLDYDSIFYNI